MEHLELAALLAQGEDSRRQFKKNITSPESLAGDLTAFSNGQGGLMAIGVDDDGTITGLTSDDVRRLNQLISNAASQGVQPAIALTTENVATERGLVMLVNVPAGLNKPYQDKRGVFWIKCGADKRRAASREEMQRLFQSSHLVHADETPAPGTELADLDLDYFRHFFNRRFGYSLEKHDQPLSQLLRNMHLLQDGCLNLAGALLFAKEPHFKLPSFVVKAAVMAGVDLTGPDYIDKRIIEGKLAAVFQETVNFILANIRHVQGGQDFNSVGLPEIPRAAIEELVANALIHRDYFISAPIRVFVFTDRVEIISPGHLPNNLTVENIKLGNSNTRNPLLASFANYLIPYSGIGSGIVKALAAYPHIDFADDRAGQQFKATLRRIRGRANFANDDYGVTSVS